MNCSRPIIRGLVHQQQRSLHSRIIIKQQQSSFLPIITTQQHTSSSILSYFSTTTQTSLALKPGTPIPGLENIYPKSKDPKSKDRTPIAKSREEYPPWVSGLTQPLPSLAKLRAMKIEDATDKDMKRYLKLVRRAKIKANNEERRKK